MVQKQHKPQMDEDSRQDPWSKFLNKIRKAKKELGCSRTGAFYRGHSSAHYSLLPSLLRNHRATRFEANLYETFKQRSASIFEQTGVSSWDILSRMQHHGLPTRMLDWTETFGIALYFAVHEKSARPCVWIMNGFKLSQESLGEPRIVSLGIDEFPDYYNSFIRKNDYPYELPLVLETQRSHLRINAQRGYFTLHGTNNLPMEQTCKRFVRKIEIEPDTLPFAIEFLEMAGIDHFSTFPDLDGLCRSLKQAYCD